MQSSLRDMPRVVGVKQLKRALDAGNVSRVYIAMDADTQVTRGVAQKARDLNLPVVEIATMKELGEACGIQVGTAACGLLRE